MNAQTFESLSDKKQAKVFADGSKLSDAELESLKTSLSVKPDDAIARAKLFSYYRLRSVSGGAEQEQSISELKKQLKWFIRNCPESIIHLLASGISTVFSTEQYDELAEAWTTVLNESEEDSKVLGNAALFLGWRGDFKRTEQLLTRAQELDPSNGNHSHYLCQFAQMRERDTQTPEGKAWAELVVKYGRQAIEIGNLGAPSLTMMYVCQSALALGQLDICAKTANELVAVSERHPPFQLRAHAFLGLVSLAKKDVNGAISHFEQVKFGSASNETQAAVELAKALYELGHRDIVISSVQKHGKDERADWLAKLNSGEFPQIKIYF